MSKKAKPFPIQPIVTSGDRRVHIDFCIANAALEGFAPSPAILAAADAYVDGAMTIDQLIDTLIPPRSPV
jgi:hypothetical protein